MVKKSDISITILIYIACWYILSHVAINHKKQNNFPGNNTTQDNIYTHCKLSYNTV